MRKFFPLVILVLLAMALGCATTRVEPLTPATADAQATIVAERPQYTPGDWWEFSNSNGERMKIKFWGDRENGDHVFTVIYGARTFGFVTDTNLNIKEVIGGSPLRPTEFLRFPFSVGEAWYFTQDFKDKVETFQLDYRCRVVSLNEIIVPAGKFSAFKIEIDYNFRLGGKTFWDELYYSPEVGYMIVLPKIYFEGEWRLKDYYRRETLVSKRG